MKSMRVEHGGGLGEGRRKVTRPVSIREPMYLVLRSTKARGKLALDNSENAAAIKTVVSRQSNVCGVELIEFINKGDSLHFLIRVPSRAAYLRFIRSVSGLISRHVTGSERGPAHAARGGRQNQNELGVAGKALKAKAKPKSQTKTKTKIKTKSKAVVEVPTGAKAASRASTGTSSKNRFWNVLPYSRIATGATSIRSAQKHIDLDIRRELGLLTAPLRDRDRVLKRARQRRSG